ncbi:MAG: hypothetical protein ACOVQA_07735 [Thermoflexibacteraceae bacterium]
MQTLYKDEFCEMSFDISSDIAYFIIYPTTVHLTKEQFYQIMFKWLQTTKDCQASKSIVDAKALNFPIEPALQEWLLREIIPHSTIQKTAFLVPMSFIENLAIEQYIEEANNVGSKTEGYFLSIHDAKVWLLEN